MRVLVAFYLGMASFQNRCQFYLME